MKDPCRLTICFLSQIEGNSSKRLSDMPPQQEFTDLGMTIFRGLKGVFFAEEYHIVCSTVIKCCGAIKSAIVRVERYEPDEREMRLNAVGAQSQWSEREEYLRQPRKSRGVDLVKMQTVVAVGPKLKVE